MMHGMCNIQVMLLHCPIGRICGIMSGIFGGQYVGLCFLLQYPVEWVFRFFSCYSTIFLIFHPQDWIGAGLSSILGYQLEHILMYVL